ncbi:hypothetical protein VR46_44685, partial [Streptomyces sp. NRRL S-444]
QAPVSGWKSLRKAERTEHAREMTQAAAARADRPLDMSPARIPDAAEGGAVVTPLRWSQRVRQAEQSIDAERRHRREQAVRRRPAPPPALGESAGRRDLFLLPEDDEEEPHGGPHAG